MLDHCRCTVIRRLKKAPSNPEVSAVHSANMDHHLLSPVLDAADDDGAAAAAEDAAAPRPGEGASDAFWWSVVSASVKPPIPEESGPFAVSEAAAVLELGCSLTKSMFR